MCNFLAGLIRWFHLLQVNGNLVDLAGEFIGRWNAIIRNDRRLEVFADISAFIGREEYLRPLDPALGDLPLVLTKAFSDIPVMPSYMVMEVRPAIRSGRPTSCGTMRS